MRKASTRFDEVLFYQPDLQIGRFRCPVSDPGFINSGPIENHVLVIPERAVEIQYVAGNRVVADPTRAMFYNRGCDIRRRALNADGDFAIWIAFGDQVVADALGSRPEAPFERPWAPLPADACLAGRSLACLLAGSRAPDVVGVAETAWWLLSRCLSGEPEPAAGSFTQKRSVTAAETCIAERFREPLSLPEIARAANTSPYHLCRVFRRLTGTTIHQRLNQVRLHSALADVLESDRPLTELALESGYSSASHFSTAFRATFGAPPSRVRGAMGRNLIAGRLRSAIPS